MSEYVPVRCLEESKYKGKCFQEPISTIKEVNGEPVVKDRQMTRTDFASSDRVVIRFKNKDYRGVVDFSGDEQTFVERVDSPVAELSAAHTATPMPVKSRNPNRKRHRSQDAGDIGRSIIETEQGKRSKNVEKRPGSVGGNGRRKQRPTASILAGSSRVIPGFGSGPSIVATPQAFSSPLVGSGTGSLLTSNITGTSGSPPTESDLQQTIKRLEDKMTAMEMKLEIALLKDEAARLKGEEVGRKRNSTFLTLLESISKDVQGLRSRQDLLFAKQDILQATIAGETPLSRTYRSGSSTLVWSPAPNSPPFTLPLQPSFRVPVPPSRTLTPTPTPTPIPSQLPQQLQDNLSVLSAEDVESVLSEQPPQSEGVPKDPDSGTTDLPGSGNPPLEQQGHSSLCPSLLHPSSTTNPGLTELGSLLLDLGIDISTAVHGCPLTSAQSTTNTGSKVEAQRTRSPLTCTTSCEDYFSQEFTSANLISPSALCEVKLRNRQLDLSNVGRFAILLARCCFFGDDVLQVSSLKGKGGRQALDAHKMEALMSVIHEQQPFVNLSKEEFSATVQKRVERSLRDYLKPSGTVAKKASSV